MELKYLDLFKCYRILTDCGGSPLGGGGWVDGSLGGYGCVRRCVIHVHTHMYAYRCTHACTCMLNMINMDASMSAAICNFFTCIHVHACVCMHVGTPPCLQLPPDTPPPTCHLPRATGSPKHQISITLELIEIIQFCLKIFLPLNIPELI